MANESERKIQREGKYLKLDSERTKDRKITKKKISNWRVNEPDAQKRSKSTKISQTRS